MASCYWAVSVNTDLADDLTQRLDRGQAQDKDMLLNHHARAQRKRDSYDGGQCFRNRRDGEADSASV